MLTQKVDPNDSALAFTVGWIATLASRVDHVSVLCLEQHPTDLPVNVTVRSMGKERGKNRLREVIGFYRGLLASIRHVDVIFCHMIPRYAILAAPLAKLFRKPIVLWYVHRQISSELRLAVAAAKFVTTAVPESFPLPTPKLRPLGHGIDGDYFQPDPACEPDSPALIVHVARLMPIKHQATLLRAMLEIPSAKAAFVGEVLRGQDETYLTDLQMLTNELGLSTRVTFMGRQTTPAVRDLYRRSTVAVNLSPDGLFDKAALESMLTGTPTIVSSRAFDPVLGESVSALRIANPDDVEGLTSRLAAILQLSTADRQRMTDAVRQRVREQHSLTGLMDRLVALFTEAPQ
jgi:glycosyltransferase involved in cell wall biosynthesis